MSILSSVAQVREPIKEGNYELPLTKVKEFTNENGGYLQLTFEDENIQIIHNIFGRNQKQIDYTIQTLGRQVEKFGDNVKLKDVLIKDHIYKIYVSYREVNGQFRRNISFGVRNTDNSVDENIELDAEAI